MSELIMTSFFVGHRCMKTTTSFIVLITFVVAVFLAAVPSCFSADQQYEECLEPLRCGTTIFPNRVYPFWGVTKPKYCGQTEFKLNCSKDQSLTLDLNDFTLRFISLNLENQTITVAEERLFEGECPSYQTLNLTGNDHFTLDPTSEKIDLFICLDSPVANPLPSFTCRRNSIEVVTYHVFTSSQPHSACRKIGVPMLKSVKDDLLRSRVMLEDALLKGYDLRYNVRDGESCRGCLISGGVCGLELGSDNFRCLCPDRPHNSSCFIEDGFGSQGRLDITPKVIIGVVGGGAIIFLVVIALVLKKVEICSRKDQNLEALVPLKRYSYAKVKKITKSFTDEIGKGGFGIVYKGTLGDGRKVAVKVLKDSKSNGEDFINEVASMSKTSHVNIVTLLGFCYEGSKRAIIYEFLENGSLDSFISSKKSSRMDWSALYGIALGVARGLEYLHNGCRERIVHFDIKPQNVLLDENLCPKVSDFGLAKLCGGKGSILSLLDTRGTIGFIAPEVFSRMYGKVSHKSDVYSYGMLVLEIVGARNKTSTEDSASNTSSIYFPEWIYKDLEKGYNKRLVENVISDEEEEVVRKMTLVGLWCIQPSPSNRPSMNRVVEMMEGSVDALEVPPRPVFPAAPLLDSSWISEDNSCPSD